MTREACAYCGRPVVATVGERIGVVRYCGRACVASWWGAVGVFQAGSHETAASANDAVRPGNSTPLNVSPASTTTHSARGQR